MTLFPRPRHRKPKVLKNRAPSALGSPEVSAGVRGVAAGRDINGSALGANSRVTYVDKQFVTPSYTSVPWPLVVGKVPVLASAFQPRDGLRCAIDEARAHNQSVVLAIGNTETGQLFRSAAEARTSIQVVSGGGGVGKSQLAAAYAREAIRAGTDLVLWAPATDLQQILTLYAHAAFLVQAPGCTRGDIEANARAFIGWLAATDRRWLVVLDDITDPDEIEPWWPDSPRGTGWVMATTRLKDPRLTGGGRIRIDVDVYTPEEAVAYLTRRLTDEAKAHLVDEEAIGLARALGFLPLALGHAAAYMLRESTPCSAYLQQFTTRAAHLDELLPDWADTERYGRHITTALLLALDATDRDPLGPLARAALRLIAVLDPEGHPAGLWDTSSLTLYLTAHRVDRPPRRAVTWHWRRTALRPVTGDEARAALRLLDRYGLITYDDSAVGIRAVRIHALTARAVRETTPTDHDRAIADAAANALLEVWPDPDQTQRDLSAALRANTNELSTHARATLWTHDCRPVLFYAGRSLLSAHLNGTALAYWRDLAAECQRLLGNDHPDTLTARHNLAVAYQQSGRTSEAIELSEQVITDRERLLGDGHPKTLVSRANLAASYLHAGRTREATELSEQVVTDNEGVLGHGHPGTLTSRLNLAAAYQEAGRTSEAIELLKQVVTDSERVLGNDHPHTLAARAKLSFSYQQTGQIGEAIELSEQVAADRERILGNDHPDTLIVSIDLASSYQQAGRIHEAIALLEQSLAVHEQRQSEDYDTLQIREALAISYRQADRISESIELLEKVVTDSERILGDSHPHTLKARADLAISYRHGGRTTEAIDLLEQVVARNSDILGTDHPNFLMLKGSLATSYWQAGRPGEAIAIEENVADSCERVLGIDHPQTVSVRSNFAMSYHDVGRTSEAIHLMKQVAADRERLLGRDHPDTLDAHAGLAYLLDEG
ncbi:tetratricopeptide repeat protein [Streptomyces avermitilis]|uniref:tetratricopeptide repeat protein n=1 Tax=Streptomyces avermitilis TaxID=33903 RepID=UPI0037F39DE7